MYKLFKYGAVLWTIFCAWGFICGMVSVSELAQQPMSEAEQAGAAIGTGLGIIAWGMIWFFPTVAACVLALLFKPSQSSRRSSMRT